MKLFTQFKKEVKSNPGVRYGLAVVILGLGLLLFFGILDAVEQETRAIVARTAIPILAIIGLGFVLGFFHLKKILAIALVAGGLAINIPHVNAQAVDYSTSAWQENSAPVWDWEPQPEYLVPLICVIGAAAIVGTSVWRCAQAAEPLYVRHDPLPIPPRRPRNTNSPPTTPTNAQKGAEVSASEVEVSVPLPLLQVFDETGKLTGIGIYNISSWGVTDPNGDPYLWIERYILQNTYDGVTWRDKIIVEIFRNIKTASPEIYDGEGKFLESWVLPGNVQDPDFKSLRDAYRVDRSKPMESFRLHK